MTASSRVSVLFVCACSALYGCSKPAPPPENKPAPPPKPAVVVPPAPSAEAKDLFYQKCVTCHGDHGMGDGPGAAALNPKPRSFSDQTWQAATTDEHIGKTIVGGGVSVGLSPAMAANPDLAQKPEVVAELVKIVRQWRK